MHFFTVPISIRATALASLVLLGACSKKSDDPTPTPTPAATPAGFSWTADNVNYTSTVANASVQGTDVYLTGISGSSGNSNTISLLVPAAVGTYSIAGAPANANYLMSYNLNAGSAATVYVASNIRGNGSGTVTVTSYSATAIVGTFSFTGDNASGGTGATTKVVTNGKFNVKP